MGRKKELGTVLYMPDGNRRYARKKNISLDEAYLKGAETLKLFSEFFVVKKRAKRFIYHAMSDYTHQRTDISLDAIYNALEKTFESLAEEEFFGRRNLLFRYVAHSKLPCELRSKANALQRATKKNIGGEVVVLLGYSLREDVSDSLRYSPYSHMAFRRHTLFPEDIDLVIRPKEMRLSGGPAYAMAQAQMIILAKLNPEVEKRDLKQVMKKYLELKRYRVKHSHNPIHKK